MRKVTATIYYLASKSNGDLQSEGWFWECVLGLSKIIASSRFSSGWMLWVIQPCFWTLDIHSNPTVSIPHNSRMNLLSCNARDTFYHFEFPMAFIPPRFKHTWCPSIPFHHSCVALSSDGLYRRVFPRGFLPISAIVLLYITLETLKVNKCFAKYIGPWRILFSYSTLAFIFGSAIETNGVQSFQTLPPLLTGKVFRCLSLHFSLVLCPHFSLYGLIFFFHSNKTW